MRTPSATGHRPPYDNKDHLAQPGEADGGIRKSGEKWRPSVDETDNYVSAGAL
jgi:hypothetical protein